MHRFLKYICFLLSAALIFNLCGCTKKQAKNTVSNTSSKAAEVSNLSNFDILYCSKDGFDPYTCKTKQNFELSYLLFDPLIKLDNNYNSVKVLADNITVNGKTCTVSLKNVTFTDGSQVTANDVAFSFKKAKRSKTVYYYSLKNASSAEVVNNNTVTFKLTKKDPYFSNCLDFPIIKSGSDTRKNSDNKYLPPIGSGRYILTDDMDALNRNKNYFLGEPSVKTISLADSPDTEADYTNIEAGLIDYYYSNLEKGEFPKMNGRKATVNLNNMVFLGMNTQRSFVGNVLFRQAISSAINRNELCEKAYFTNATPAIGPFPSAFQPAKDFQTISASSNTNSFNDNIAKLGYNNKNSEGLLLSGKKPITIELLVNKDNTVRTTAANQIADQLLKVGITVNVKSVSNGEYQSRINAKNYDMYLGEMRISNNMDLTELLGVATKNAVNTSSKANSSKSANSSKTSSGSSDSSKNTVSKNTNSSNSSAVTSSENSAYIGVTAKTALSKFYSGEYSLGDFITVFTSELPVIPVVFRTGIAMYSNNIKCSFNPSQSDLFFGFEKLK